MKRAALYVRVSTEEQKKHGISVDSQITALKAYSDDNNYSVYKIYNDAGISARKSYKKRPALLELIEDCKNKKIDIILFTKLDRWFRSVADYYEVQSQLEACNIPWRAIWEDYETETSAGIFKVNIMLSVAQSEADRTSERIKATFEYKKQKGEYYGGNKAPVGYSRDGKHYIINEQEKAGTEAFFKTYEATFSIAKACESAKEYDLDLNWNKAERMINHTIYYGLSKEGFKVPAYITKQQYDLFQSKKKRKTRTSRANNQYIFSGLCICKNCGTMLISNRSKVKLKDNTTKEHIYYTCRKHERKCGCEIGASIKEDVLENYLVENVEKELNNYILECKNIYAKNNNEKEIASIKAKLKRIGDRYENDEITKEEYLNKIAPLKEILMQKEEKPSIIPESLPSNWFDIYSALDAEHKKSFWFHIIDRIEIGCMSCKQPIIYFK